MPVRVRVLGPVAVSVDGEDIALGPQLRRLLALLAVNAERVVSSDLIAETLWPDGEGDPSAKAVRTYVARLRQSIDDGNGSLVETRAPGYVLLLGDPHQLDSRSFADAVHEAQHADPVTRVTRLDEALAMWAGQPYAEFADEAWARAEVARLEELRASAIEYRFQALLDSGRHTEVIGPLREAVDAERWREARRMQLALALYRSGRQAEALEAIRDYRSELVDELGLDPSPEFDRLEHQVLEHDPALLPASHQQHMLRGYQLNEVIGEGAFSLVWRGRQPGLGRTVAVKQIRAELANQPDFVRHFETEAQTVARLEHPYIVPLYDYWREPDSAYLVMRYVAGGTLEAEVMGRGLEEYRLLRLVDQVGSALHTAHQMGVIHRDVKSANVLLDEDSNFYLTDFGIALTGSTADDERVNQLSTGSPAYASPEQLRGQPVDQRADIYGFGITLFEAATGRLPFAQAPDYAALVQRQLEDPVPVPSSIVGSVPRWVDEVVARATAKNPADRFASLTDLLAAIQTGATDGTVGSRTLVATRGTAELVNPFKALRAFREADASEFYGRDRLVARFIEVLAQPSSAGRLLAVVGPSGSGKSSAVRSGLLPELRSGAIPGSSDWFMTTMLPGTRPFDELEAALGRVAVRQPGPLVEMMRSDERGISRAVGHVLPDDDSELFLVIDQFEELFTHAPDADRALFLEGLLDAIRQPRTRLRVAVTIRADFWDRPLRHSGLARHLETAAVTVSPLVADELEAAIVEPVRSQGGDYEPGLVARIIADVGDQPGALPLLQYALTELFETNVSGLIRTEGYQAIGGLTGALAQRAEATLMAMTEDQQLVARRLFGRLVTLGEGTDDTRRRVPRNELGDDSDTMPVADALGDARLLVFDRDPATREPTVEIAHEALLRAWPRLRGWLDEDREDLRIHRHLTGNCSAWLASGRDHGELYRGGRLETAAAWAADHPADLNVDEREFLDASIAAEEAERAAELERFAEQVRHNRRLRVLAGVASLVAVIAVVAGVVALQQWSRADDEAAEAARRAAEVGAAQEQADENEAVAQQQAGEAEVARDEAERGRLLAEATQLAQTGDDPDLGMLLAAQAHTFAEEDLAALGALQQVLVRTDGFLGHLVGEGGYSTNGLRFSADRLIARSASLVEVWDPATRKLLATYEVGPGSDLAVAQGHAFTPSDEDLVVIDLEDDAGFEVLDSEGSVTAVDVSTDGETLVVGHRDGTVEIWTGPGWNDRRPVGRTPRAATHVALSPDDQTVAAINSGALALFWDVASGDLVFPDPASAADPGGDEFSDRFDLRWVDDDRVTAAVGLFLVFDVGAPEEPIVDIPGRLESALAVVDASHAIQGNEIFDIRTGEVVRTLDAGDGAATAAAVSAEGTIALATDRAISLFSTDGTQLLAQAVPRDGSNVGFVDASGNNVIALRWGGEDFTIWDVDHGTSRGPEFGYEPNTPVMATYTPSGGLMTYDWVTEATRFWDDQTLEPLGPPIPSGWLSLTISPDRSLAALGLAEGQIHIYDVASAERLATLSEAGTAKAEAGLPTGSSELRFSWDGSMLVAVGDWIGIWDTDTWELIELLAPPDGDPGYATVALSRSGDILASGSTDGRLTLFDTSTWTPITEPIPGGPAGASPAFGTHGMRFSEDDRYIVFASPGGAQLFEVDRREFVGGEWPNLVEELLHVNPGPSGRSAVAGIGDHLIVWNLDPDSWLDIACKAAGRSLTEDEWAQFIGDEPYDPAC